MPYIDVGGRRAVGDAIGFEALARRFGLGRRRLGLALAAFLAVLALQ